VADSTVDLFQFCGRCSGIGRQLAHADGGVVEGRIVTGTLNSGTHYFG
jgi:hypothetical protein